MNAPVLQWTERQSGYGQWWQFDLPGYDFTVIEWSPGRWCVNAGQVGGHDGFPTADEAKVAAEDYMRHLLAPAAPLFNGLLPETED